MNELHKNKRRQSSENLIHDDLFFIRWTTNNLLRMIYVQKKLQFNQIYTLLLLKYLV